MDFQAIRKEYEDRGIDAQDLDESPIRQFEIWLQDATDGSPGRWFEQNAMALATADSNGTVSVRYVLLKGIVAEGIRFFTNYDSVKARQLQSNSKCSVAFHWPFMGRQVRISGIAEKTSREVSAEYFDSRPRGSQLSASISNQSGRVGSRAELESQLAEIEQQFDNAKVPLPENWGGYLIRPDEFEFWQGRTNRLHDRIAYHLDTATQNWQKTRLAP